MKRLGYCLHNAGVAVKQVPDCVHVIDESPAETVAVLTYVFEPAAALEVAVMLTPPLAAAARA